MLYQTFLKILVWTSPHILSFLPYQVHTLHIKECMNYKVGKIVRGEGQRLWNPAFYLFSPFTICSDLPKTGCRCAVTLNQVYMSDIYVKSFSLPYFFLILLTLSDTTSIESFRVLSVGHKMCNESFLSQMLRSKQNPLKCWKFLDSLCLFF